MLKAGISTWNSQHFLTKHGFCWFIFGHLSPGPCCMLVHSIFSLYLTVCSVMVKIQKRLVKKRYYGKAEYQYPVYSLTIPKQYHNLLQPFLDEDLEANVEHATNTLTITLKPAKWAIFVLGLFWVNLKKVKFHYRVGEEHVEGVFVGSEESCHSGFWHYLQ